MRRMLMTTAMLGLTVGVGGCARGSAHPTGTQPVVLQTHPTSEVAMTALHGGKLDLSKRTDGLVCSDLGNDTHLIWPNGFTTDGVTVYDVERHLVALTGDTISVGGGYEPLSTPPDPCGPSEQAWQVAGIAQRGP